MSGSRTDAAGRCRRARGLALGALTAAMVVVALPAAPSAQEQPVGPPLRLLPPEPSPPPAAPPAAGPTAPLPPPVQAVPLGPPDFDGAGVLDEAGGGFPRGLWRGTRRSDVARLLAALPGAVASPAQRELTLRLLLTDADAPEVPAEDPPPPRRLSALRVAGLAALGDAAGASALALRLPDALIDEAAAVALSEAELIAGRPDCDAVPGRAGPFSGRFWQRLDVYCRAVTGDRPGAQLGLALLRELGDGEGPFVDAIESILGDAAEPLRAAPEPDPLTLAALEAAGPGLPPAATAGYPAEALAVVARMNGVDPLTRVEAAEAAAAAMLLDADALAAAYRAVPARGDERRRVVDGAAAAPSALSRALVFQAAHDTAPQAGADRAALAGVAAGLVPPRWRAGPAGAVALGLFAPLTPSPQTAGSAAAAARLAYAQGRLEAARRWHALVLSSGRGGEALALWPLAAVAGGLPPEAGTLGITGWIDGALRAGGADATERAAGLLALLAGVGHDVPDAVRTRVGADAVPPPADPALLDGLAAAAAAGRVGETVLTGLVLLGPAGPAGAPPAVTGRVVAALRAAGLPAEARALAREAAAALVE